MPACYVLRALRGRFTKGACVACSVTMYRPRVVGVLLRRALQTSSERDKRRGGAAFCMRVQGKTRSYQHIPGRHTTTHETNYDVFE